MPGAGGEQRLGKIHAAPAAGPGPAAGQRRCAVSGPRRPGGPAVSAPHPGLRPPERRADCGADCPAAAHPVAEGLCAHGSPARGYPGAAGAGAAAAPPHSHPVRRDGPAGEHCPGPAVPAPDSFDGRIHRRSGPGLCAPAAGLAGVFSGLGRQPCVVQPPPPGAGAAVRRGPSPEGRTATVLIGYCYEESGGMLSCFVSNAEEKLKTAQNSAPIAVR